MTALLALYKKIEMYLTLLSKHLNLRIKKIDGVNK